MAWRDKAGLARQAWRGRVGHGLAWRGKAGMARLGATGHGTVRQARRGLARCGLAGMAGEARQDMIRQGKA
jgi:hypothetical protein